MRVAVITPFQSESPDRIRNQAWTERWWKAHFPQYQYVRGVATPWSRARAGNRAVKATDADVLVLADADVVADRLATVQLMVEAAEVTGWASPALLCGLFRGGTTRLLDSSPGDRRGLEHLGPVVDVDTSNAVEILNRLQEAVAPLDVADVFAGGVRRASAAYPSLPGGRFVHPSPLAAVQSTAFREAGGYDERFEGWPVDDVALGLILEVVAGPASLVPGVTLHLRHDGNRSAPEPSARLLTRYMAARGDPAALRRLRFESDEP